MKLISLDIEATDSGEILEISIFRCGQIDEIYHSFFKPVHTDRWTNKAHHITPEMVKDAPCFRDERAKIQEIINEADGIVGFALQNDIKYLKNHNVIIPPTVFKIDVRDWFWYYIGKEFGLDFDTVPRLSKCAELMGFNFSEEKDAHSATNDTKMTVIIFQTILEKSCEGVINKEIIETFIKTYEKEKEKNAEVKAKGVLSLCKKDNSYILKNNVYKGQDLDYLSIIANSRYVAEHEIRETFKSREVSQNSGTYNLKQKDIDFFLEYSNTYDAVKEEFYRSIYNAKRSRKKRLNFNIK